MNRAIQVNPEIEIQKKENDRIERLLHGEDQAPTHALAYLVAKTVEERTSLKSLEDALRQLEMKAKGIRENLLRTQGACASHIGDIRALLRQYDAQPTTLEEEAPNV